MLSKILFLKHQLLFFSFLLVQSQHCRGMQVGNKPKYQWEYIVYDRFVLLNNTLKGMYNDY